MPTSTVVSQPEPWWQKVAAVVRRIIGAPDYERYVLHMGRNHPECTVLSRDAFTKESLDNRYSKPGSRCC